MEIDIKRQKVQLAIKSLYAAAAIQLISAAYAMYQIFETNQEIKSISRHQPGMYEAYTVSYISSASFFAAIITVGAILVSKELKEDRPWAWLGAIGILILSVFGWSLPAGIIGLVALLDSRVRGEYLKRLDIAL